MKKDKEEGGRNGAETTETNPLERLAELTRKLLAVPKSEIDDRERAVKRRPRESTR